MADLLLRLRIMFYGLKHDLVLLISRSITIREFFHGIRKQLKLSSVFRDARYAKVGKRYYTDPFAPYFPGKYFKKMLENNTEMHFPLKPNYAQISVTNICPCECFHCHVQNTQDRSRDLPREMILRTIEEMIVADFPLLFFVGGEPMSRFDDLGDFIKAASRGMDTRIFTSGMGVTADRLKILKKAGLGGICVSLDHYQEEVHNAQRKNNSAFKQACYSISEASRQGIYVSAVCCTTGELARSGEFKKVVDLAESLGAHSVQLNEIRPVGRANSKGNRHLFLDNETRNILIDYYKAENSGKRKISIVLPWYNEYPDKLGCMATSGQNVYVDSVGNVQPCVLLNASLGNLHDHSFKEIWDKFTPLCSHPVRECIVHTLRDTINNSTVKPLPPEETLDLWPAFSKLEPADMYKKIKVKNKI